jgi:hypothetical protein
MPASADVALSSVLEGTSRPTARLTISCTMRSAIQEDAHLSLRARGRARRGVVRRQREEDERNRDPRRHSFVEPAIWIRLCLVGHNAEYIRCRAR